jgi:hypothetical protein
MTAALRRIEKDMIFKIIRPEFESCSNPYNQKARSLTPLSFGFMKIICIIQYYVKHSAKCSLV